MANSPSDRCLLVIPARRHSTRLPDKLLLRDTGKTVLQHTYEAACQSLTAAKVLVATDDREIVRDCRRFGAQAILTSPSCPSGTDRVAEVAREYDQYDIVVNLQGDEPEIEPAAIDLLTKPLLENPFVSMATLATPIRDRQTLEDPACVKVVFDDVGRALYFSRSPIPYVRDWDEKILAAEPPQFFQHVGIYAFRRDLLLQLSALPPSQHEQLERLEQLRALNLGEQIQVSVIDEPTRGIDTPADYAAFVRRHMQAA